MRIELVRTVLLVAALCAAQASRAHAAGFPWKDYAAKSDDWYRSALGRRVMENVLSYQSDRGDWPKNLDTSKVFYDGDRKKLQGTFDNGATVGEVRFLARAYRVTNESRDRAAVEKALDHILAAQYPTGGWPQTSPPGKGYARYITFNDDTMVNLLELLRDAARSDDFAFLDASRRAAATRRFDAGIACILKCQIVVDGRPTVWCAQHDDVTLEPRGARAFELVGLSGSESAGILMLLMSLDNPGPEVVRAVDAGARWFEASKLTGLRVVSADGDRKVVADPKAPPLWARFYEIDTNRPFFCGRDGVKKERLADIERERRTGYAWYGVWGRKIANRYDAWSKARKGPGS
jgi:PelA/Pel-15E family pectate lyase